MGIGRKVFREATKFVIGVASGIGAGAIATTAALAVPMYGMGKVITGIGALGIGSWVARESQAALASDVDAVFSASDKVLYARGKYHIDEFTKILKDLDNGTITKEEAKERLANLKKVLEEEASTKAETADAPETEE